MCVSPYEKPIGNLSVPFNGHRSRVIRVNEEAPQRSPHQLRTVMNQSHTHPRHTDQFEKKIPAPK